MAVSARPASGLRLADLAISREKALFAVSALVGLLVWLGLVGAVVLAPSAAGGIIMYVAMFAVVGIMMQGIMIGHIRANGIKVGPRQFPEVHRMATEHARRIGMKKVPDVFVLQAGGTLNAFATKFFGRHFVVLYSDVLELAYERGEAALGFVVAHELGHHHRGHLNWRWLLLPSRIVPYLGAAYSRACEYTCDRYGAFCQPDGAFSGLLVLAAGKQLYGRVNLQEYINQVETEKGYWVRRAETMSTHPPLPKRLAALAKAGVSMPVPVPAYSPMNGAVPAPAVA